MKSTALGLLLALAVSFSARAASEEPATPPELYDGYAEISQYIESFDGTRIAITVRRPARDGVPASEALPVIVTQDRSASFNRTGPLIDYFTGHGYVWVAQDRRGTGASFGVQTGFVNQADARDASAVIEWAAAQPFSNGKVVAFGCSNQGAWQYVVAALAPAHLVAIAPSCSSPQFFDHGISMNGVPIYKVPDRPYAGECNGGGGEPTPPGYTPPPVQPVDADTDGAMLAAAQERRECNAPFLGQYWLNMPRDGLDSHAGYAPGIEDSAISHAPEISGSGIAILQIGGWFDAAVAGQFEGQRIWGGRVIMGPWVHGSRVPKGADFPAGTIDLNAETLRWFDLHAKGIQNGADQPAIRYYTLNAPAGEEWRDSPGWPPAGVQPVRLYFSEQGLATAQPPEGGAGAVYPQQDVPWFDGRYMALGRWWAGDMSPYDDRSLSATAAPYEQDTEMTGTPTARLWVSADAPDVNIFAVLEDVAPDGRSTYVTDGRLRASWRRLTTPPWGESPEHWHRGYQEDIEPLTPGEPAELVFDFFPASYVFRAGHSLRVSVATSIGKPFQAPPLAGGKAPTITLYRDAAHPSAVDIPVIGSGTP